jgi:hypothetical protein
MADYPNNDPSDGSLLIAANNVASTLNGGISASATEMTMASTAHFTSKGGCTVESEAIIWTSNNTATAVLSGLTRGADSTTAAVHANGTAVYMNMQARHHNALKDEVIAIASDLRNSFESDLDDSANVSTTAANLKGRLDQIVTQIKSVISETDWKTTPSNVIRGWINFNGVNTITTSDSFNVTSITDLGTGDYTITWNADFSNDDYCVQVTCLYPAFPTINNTGALAVGSTRVFIQNSAGAGVDTSVTSVLAVGDQ